MSGCQPGTAAPTSARNPPPYCCTCMFRHTRNLPCPLPCQSVYPVPHKCCMGSHGLSGTLMDSDGLSGTLMGPDGLSWTFMDRDGPSWTFMDIHALINEGCTALEKPLEIRMRS
eukprot:358565-Chlamydomonas_euryale.AAC.4